MTIKIENIIAIASFIVFPSLINFKYRECLMYRTINNFSVVFLIHVAQDVYYKFLSYSKIIYVVSRFQPACRKVAISISVLPLREYGSAKDLTPDNLIKRNGIYGGF